MSSWDDYIDRQSQANIIDPEHPCAVCTHRLSSHAGQGRCAEEVEVGHGLGMTRCSCKHFEPMTEADLREDQDEQDE